MPIKLQILGADALERIGKLTSQRKEKLLEDFVEASNKFGLNAVYLAKTKYLRGPKPARIESKGALKASINTTTERDGNVIRTSVGSPLIYARIQEQGGTTRPTVSDRMRKFAWYMYFNSRDDKWKRLALTRKTRLTIKIPARPYLRPSIKDAMPTFQQNLRRILTNLRFTEAFGG